MMKYIDGKKLITVITSELMSTYCISELGIKIAVKDAIKMASCIEGTVMYFNATDEIVVGDLGIDTALFDPISVIENIIRYVLHDNLVKDNAHTDAIVKCTAKRAYQLSRESYLEQLLGLT